MPRFESAKVATYWHEIDNAKVQCDVCPRHCQLKPGKQGFCTVRENHDGQLILNAYGRSTGFSIDPIEKKPLHHFYPSSSILSFGTIGCNLDCQFCQNWHMSKSKDSTMMRIQATPEAIASFAKQENCMSVAFTYNEPIIFCEYAIDAAKSCHDLGIQTAAVTAGYIEGQARNDFFSNMDAANIDLKAFSDQFYKKYCSAALQPVLDTLAYVKHETNCWLEITNLLIPDANDKPEDIQALCKWIVTELGPDVPLHLTAFTPHHRVQDRTSTPKETLVMAREIALSQGLYYVYTGNVHGIEEQSTYCPQCRAIVVERDWHRVRTINIQDGKCSHCQTPIAGRFS